MWTIIPTPKLRARDVLPLWRRAWHLVRHWQFAPRPRVVITDDTGRRLFTHPDNVDTVRQLLTDAGHPCTVGSPQLQSIAGGAK